MHLLLCTGKDQQSYLARFSRLAALVGHRTSILLAPPDTLAELESLCKRSGIDGILCAEPSLLSRVLDATIDFKRPNNRRALTLDDYQGSLLSLRSGIPVVVLNPPEHLMTVPYGAFIFSRFIKKITAPKEWYPQTKFEWLVADDPRILKETFAEFQTADLISIDIETPVPNPEFLISCISFTAYYAALHKSKTIVIPFTSMFNLVWIRKFCSLPAPKILQGGSYDAVYLLRFNCPIHNYLFDTLNLFHSWYSELPKRLDFVSAFALRNIRYWKQDGKGGNLDDYYRYNAMDGWATLNSFLALVAELPDWATRNYLEEFPLVFPAIHCELEGWKIDPERFKAVSTEKERAAEDKLRSIRRILKAPNFNPRSPKQMLNLFKVLGCGDLTSTDKANTMKAEFRHPLNARILGDIKEYKEAAKLLSTYIVEDKFLKSKHGWRLLYRLNPAGTDSGRLASSESSFWVGFQIQNIPRGDSIKQFMVSDNGWYLAEPDFEQSEARCVAYQSGDRKLISLVESGKDYHSWNVREFFGIPYEQIWDDARKTTINATAKEIRDLSKRTNHGANYNMTEGVMLDTMGPKHVSKAKTLLKLPSNYTLKQTCKYCLDRYDQTYVGIKTVWYPSILLALETTKKLVSPLGHTRHFFGDPKENRHYKNAAIAHGPQNLSVGIMNKGFYKIWWESVYGKFVGVLRLKAQIHDSCPYQYKAGAEWVNTEVQKILTLPVKVVGADKVTRTMIIPVGMKAGKERWSELK